MRTLVWVLLLSAAAYCQVVALPSAQPASALANGNKHSADALDPAADPMGVGLATFASLRPAELYASSVSVAPVVSTATVVTKQHMQEPPAANMKLWYAVTVLPHAAAAFDGWTTREVISSGKGRELNPFMKPFANSAAIYPALQVVPASMDYLGLRFMRSRSPLLRKLWWTPQVASAAISVACGIHNLGVIK
ncbi:MAG TPA: hypothetical protein VFA76_04280 [Terriglobales bacterium]|nr:hypothetical protein [Terriglobales bacterium]